MNQNSNQRLEEVKNEIVDKGLVFGSIAGVLIYAIDVYDFESTRFLTSIISDFVILLLLIGATFLRKKLNVYLKSSLILFCIFLLSITDLIEFGVFSSNKILLVLFPFFSVLIFSVKRMSWIFSGLAITIAIIATLHIVGVLEAKVDNQSGLRFWVINFAMIVTVCYVSLILIKKYNRAFHEILKDLTLKNDEITRNERHLRQYKDKLELLVEKRTSELKKANQELKSKAQVLNDALANLSNTQERLIHSEKMASLGMLASGVAHEINNPLNHIQGGVTRLGMHLSDDSMVQMDQEVNSLLSEINEGIQRAASIVTSLNRYGPSNNNLNEKCDLHEIITKSIAICNGNHDEKFNIQTSLDASNSLILGNSGKLHQVMINLITNAMHAINEDGEINIISVSSKDSLVITVIDNGMGIGKDQISRIYEPFYTTKEIGKGTGLGLYIVFGIVQEHQGSIKVESKEGSGTEFVLTFPLL
ncbi:MAG: GHKL domain-containing protein [Cyclobacteriaceae bacterium]